VIEDGIPERVLVRQHPPPGLGAQQVEDRVDDALKGINLSPPSRMAAGDQRLEQRPFVIIEIAGVGTDIHGGGSRIVKQPIRLSGPAPNRF
jgi:hypothetical protein